MQMLQRIVVVLCVLSVLAHGVLVGSDGSIPPNANSWGFSLHANTVTVHDGDVVVFQWTNGNGPHSVYAMSSAANWKVCNFAGGQTLLEAASVGNYQFDTTGLAGQTRYFACTVGSHCTDGVKITLVIKPPAPCSSFKTKAKCAAPSCKWNAKTKKCLAAAGG